jgi:hypothetical protein
MEKDFANKLWIFSILSFLFIVLVFKIHNKKNIFRKLKI